jgi:DNA-binding GntR family transcriptional regulator
MQLIALSLLAASERPAGAASLVSSFESAGVIMAEATAGRFLRQLDLLGYTRSIGKRGRRLTQEGERRLEVLRLHQELAVSSARVAAAASARDADELIELLYVRRAVESEAARLAAIRASAEEIGQIVDAAATHVSCVDHLDRFDLSNDFHLLVAKASRSPMISAITTMLLERANAPLGRLLDQIADQSGSIRPMALHHEAVAEAVAVRASERAEELMRSHIDELIAVVVAYRDEQLKSESGATSGKRTGTAD